MTSETKEYARGYAAGKRKSAREIEGLKLEIKALGANVSERKERIYMKCLHMVLEHCGGWAVDGKEINNAKGYCTLARIFEKNAISEMGK